MWTNVSPTIPKTWTPNHFVPLLDSSYVPEAIRISSSDSSRELTLFDVPKNPYDNIPEISFSPIDDVDDPVFMYDRQEVFDSAESTEYVPRSSTPADRKRVMESSLSDQHEVSASTESAFIPEKNYDPLPNMKFMSIAQLFDVTRNSDIPLRDTVPLGQKNDVFFVVKNDINLEKIKMGQRNDFVDDCGVWDSQRGNTVNSYAILDSDGLPKVIYLKKELFCFEKRVRGKTTWVPLSPQPSDTIQIHRYYATLKSDEQYKKRVTTISGKDFPPVAIFEYCGTRSSDTIHGNAKRQKIAYVRTDPKVLKKIQQQVNVKPPRRIYQDMAEEDSFEAPRDFKQVRNVKYRQQKKTRQQYRNNVADEVLTVIGMLEENPNVKQIVLNKGKTPCVIIYSDFQLEDMKRSLSSGNVLGVDRTFNLGAWFVTAAVYKNSSVVTHKETGDDNPLFLGPMYLHWDGEFETYHLFFSHLQCKLFDSVTSFELKLGSDQESASLKAMKCCFPGATRILCSKHLKDNVSRYLCNKVGCPTSKRNMIVNKIFGVNI